MPEEWKVGYGDIWTVEGDETEISIVVERDSWIFIGAEAVGDLPVSAGDHIDQHRLTITQTDMDGEEVDSISANVSATDMIDTVSVSASGFMHVKANEGYIFTFKAGSASQELEYRPVSLTARIMVIGVLAKKQSD